MEPNNKQAYIVGSASDLIKTFCQRLETRGYQARLDTARSLETILSCLVSVQPDLLFFAVNQIYPSMGETLDVLHAAVPAVPIYLLAADRDGPEILAHTGAVPVAGYISLDSPDDCFELLLQLSLWKWKIIPSSWLRASLEKKLLGEPYPGSSEPGVTMDALTERELSILDLVCQGMDNYDIACRLNIRVSTVKSHIHRILSKLNMTNRRQAALWRFQNSTLSVE